MTAYVLDGTHVTRSGIDLLEGAGHSVTCDTLGKPLAKVGSTSYQAFVEGGVRHLIFNVSKAQTVAPVVADKPNDSVTP